MRERARTNPKSPVSRKMQNFTIRRYYSDNKTDTEVSSIVRTKLEIGKPILKDKL